MKRHIFLLFVCICWALSLSGQEKKVTVLGDVYVSNHRLKDSIYTKNVSILNDSILQQSQASLTNLLNFNSVVYFKENGLGMVSSPSFRGTTASQTAVLWNGININSQTTGQTDFNTISIRGFDQVEVNPGGSSAVDASSAIGGSINLVNQIKYQQGFTNQVFMNYGEYNTYGVDYRTGFSNKNFSVRLGISKNASDNDYKYPNSHRKNINGQYQNTNISLGIGTKLDAHNSLNILANVYDGRRNFSVPTPNAMKTKYTDFNTRAMLEWENKVGKWNSNLKFVTLTEEYQYFANISNDFHTGGSVESVIAKYALDYNFSRYMLLSGGLQYTQNSGRGSDIESEKRQLASALIGWKHKLSDTFFYELSLRQETNEDYDNPLLYSAGAKVKFSNFYQLGINTSRNYRIPTFNDLYWEGLGNRDLKPEESYQGEISNNFNLKNASLVVTGYYNSIKNLLSWVPDSKGIFRPQNTNEVEIYGIEAIFNGRHNIGQNQFNLAATYAYTVSENKETGRQLIYVPFHKFTASFGYAYKRFSAYYQYLNNDEVFTTTDHAAEHILDAYMVSNLGAEYSFGERKHIKLGVQALNLWNASYSSVTNRPMPGRNFNAYLNLNF